MRLIPVVVAVAATATACSGNPFERFFSSGERYLAAHKFTDAAIEFQNATRANPESASAQSKLGDAYAGLNQTSSAAAAYQRACALNPGDATACVAAAAKFLALGEFDTAVGEALSGRA